MTILASLLLATAVGPAPTGAAGVLVSLHAPVRVERAGGAPPAPELGMRLLSGDVVVVGPGGSAMLYLAGGGIERVAEGARFTVRGGDAAPKAKGATRLSTESMKASESGLWVLNDPQGSILVAAMRGGEGDAWDDASEVRADLLSPRYETASSRTPRFVASGGARPARIAVAAGKDVLWRSGPLEANGPWSPEGFPSLDAAKVYLWRLESATGSPLSEWVPFRVPSTTEAEGTQAFEAEVTSLGNDAADVLRCGRYLQTSSWTELLAASTRLLASQPDSTLAQRARESALRGLRLDAGRAAALVAPPAQR